MKPTQKMPIFGLGLARRRAFTLVEVLLAFLILMLGIIAVLSLFPVGMKLSQQTVETSEAAIIAKNARGCMEATDLADHIAGDAVGIVGGAIPGGFPPPGATTARYFPGDMAAIATTYFLPAIKNNNVKPAIDAAVNAQGQIIDSANPLYSWDARFDIGRGAFRTWVDNSGNDTGAPWGWAPADAQSWFAKYFRYYVVNISVYRGYRESPIGGTISNINQPDHNDVNRIPIGQLSVPGGPPPDVQVGWYVRCKDDHSDWYRIQKIDTNILTLDRAYTGASGSGHIVATGSLVGHYTTLLAAFND